MKFLDETCRTKLRNLNPKLAEMAEQLARHVVESDGHKADIKLGFLKDDQPATGECAAELIIRVTRVGGDK